MENELNSRLYTALVVEEGDDGLFRMALRKKEIRALPAGEVLVRVRYSSLNYKDALSATGNRGVTRSYPHTPGIDAAGEVVASDDVRFAVGDRVLVTGYDLGMNTSGGYQHYIRVPAEWVVPLPEGLSPDDAMRYGTAGFTAAQCVAELVGQVSPESGEVVVTGASGGVGSIAVALLARCGYRVVAVSGKAEARPYLLKLGAARVLGRDELPVDDGRPLLKVAWAGAVDTVGGAVLAGVIRSMQPFGVVSCCGNAGGFELPLTVYPFILRGVRLAGVSSQNCPMARRQEIWQLLAGQWKLDNLADICEEVGLEGLEGCIKRILAGKLQGRVLVNLDR